jgi:hypothetical protein
LLEPKPTQHKNLQKVTRFHRTAFIYLPRKILFYRVVNFPCGFKPDERLTRLPDFVFPSPMEALGSINANSPDLDQKLAFLNLDSGWSTLSSL